MSLVGSSNHWMFVASNGALTAGRQHAGNALFPYYSSDKLIDLQHSAGPKTIIRCESETGNSVNWQPFKGLDPAAGCSRNLYKNYLGSRIYFEEVNQVLNLTFRYSWEFSDEFGFIRQSQILNLSDKPIDVSVLDGVCNIMPSGIDEMFQMRYSNLGDAFKKSELLTDSNIGVYYLSSVPTDRAEPSEGLRATVVWHKGLADSQVLLGEQQLENFQAGISTQSEMDLRGRRGSYLVTSSFNLSAGGKQAWTIGADVGLDQTDVSNLEKKIESKEVLNAVRADIVAGEDQLRKLVGAADGIQVGGRPVRTQRHQSNVVFNLMRGGTPLHGYCIPGSDVVSHIKSRNQVIYEANKECLDKLASTELSFDELVKTIEVTGDADLIRIANEYLPFTFGRRHGDPSRPWNKFSIDLKNEDGSQRLDYQGNWRDIFQNWEAVGVSYPLFFNAMVLRFVNASTADGYNPYRINKSGFDWEKPDPEDPWANIGYWGDHQIIYLAKLLEWSRDYFPEKFQELLVLESGVYADVPYRIADYEAILKDANSTITYDLEAESAIEERVAKIGFDGQLLVNQSGEIQRVCLMEKLVLPALIKMSNFIPGGGIWLNTQRPEWNDANNALVGNGLSVVTVCYLRRYFAMLADAVKASGVESFSFSVEVIQLFDSVARILESSGYPADSGFGDAQRRQFVDQLQTAGCAYRGKLYAQKFSGERGDLQASGIVDFAECCIEVLDQTIRDNQRQDGLFHAYNLLEFQDEGLKVEHLYEMLEGQVAALSSRTLSPKECVEALEALRSSAIYRADIGTYLLYPDRNLPRFMEKNLVSATSVKDSELIRTLLDAGDRQIVTLDAKGNVRFNGDFRNSGDLTARLTELANGNAKYRELIDAESDSLVQIFETTFNHRQFTGRSGTFFGYEGLGSVYWHMVSKLALAVQENYAWAVESGASTEVVEKLKAHYREIRDGLGVESTARSYGAFPTDPYSHTPGHAGAQQPGMTGQVKEDILARLAEIGVRIRNGKLAFEPSMVEQVEFLTIPSEFCYYDLSGNENSISLMPGTFAFTICQVPVVFDKTKEAGTASLRIISSDKQDSRDGCELTAEESLSIFLRKNEIQKIEFSF